MYSKLQFDFDEQNTPVISFRKSGDLEDVRDKMAARFFEGVSNDLPFLVLEYDQDSLDWKDPRGKISAISEEQVLKILSSDMHLRFVKDSGNTKEFTIALESDEDPRLRVFNEIIEEGKVKDFKEVLKISQAIGFILGTTPFHNAGWESKFSFNLRVDGRPWLINCFYKNKHPHSPF